MNLKLKQLLRLFRKIATWPYKKVHVTEYQLRREAFFARMLASTRIGHINFCSLGVYYVSTKESCEEMRQKPCSYLQDRTLEVFSQDLEARIQLLELVTDPDKDQVVIARQTLTNWQWNDDLRLAMDIPNEQYDQAKLCINELLEELSTLPA